jgi:hypothetical protein
MKLSEINEWLNLLANIGVFAGILFLAFEIQQNSNIARTAAYNDNINSFNEWRYQVVSDPEALSMMADYRDVNDVTALKKDIIINSQWAIYEQAFYSYSYGLMAANEWERFKGSVCTNYRRVLNQKNAVLSVRITRDFGTYIEANCSIEEPPLEPSIGQ